MNNPYDNEVFFEKYKQMPRSQAGLAGAGEWQTLEKLLPDFKQKKVLDLGCGFGWHCLYAAENGAASVVGLDLSEKMLAVAQKQTPFEHVHYQQGRIESSQFAEDRFDVVISSLAIHYLPSFEQLLTNVRGYLKNNGQFIFSVEHPIFTADGSQEWVYTPDGEIDHFPVDHYFDEGLRQTQFLGEEIVKYHRTVTTYVDTLLTQGFQIERLVEPMPPDNMLTIPGMQAELRRPMMLIISATNKK